MLQQVFKDYRVSLVEKYTINRRLRVPLVCVVALKIAFSIFFGEATDTDSEDNAEDCSGRSEKKMLILK